MRKSKINSSSVSDFRKKLSNLPYLTTNHDYELKNFTRDYRQNLQQSTVAQTQMPLSNYNSAASTSFQPFKGESRFEYIPYQKPIIEYEEQEVVSYVPKERKVVDYYAVEYQTEKNLLVNNKKYQPFAEYEYMPVEKYTERVEYQQIEKQIVHQPQSLQQSQVNLTTSNYLDNQPQIINSVIEAPQTYYQQQPQVSYIQAPEQQTVYQNEVDINQIYQQPQTYYIQNQQPQYVIEQQQQPVVVQAPQQQLYYTNPTIQNQQAYYDEQGNRIIYQQPQIYSTVNNQEMGGNYVFNGQNYMIAGQEPQYQQIGQYSTVQQPPYQYISQGSNVSTNNTIYSPQQIQYQNYNPNLQYAVTNQPQYQYQNGNSAPEILINGVPEQQYQNQIYQGNNLDALLINNQQTLNNRQFTGTIVSQNPGFNRNNNVVNNVQPDLISSYIKQIAPYENLQKKWRK